MRALDCECVVFLWILQMAVTNNALSMENVKPSAVQSQAKRPHIVFVLVDDYGYNDIGYHGSEIKTPTLDKISSDGVRLENYYVQPMCSPSRAQFLSGRYQIHTGLQHGIIWHTQENALPVDSPTIADKLREAGYATHMVGKWHVGFYMTKYLPIRRGFDTFYGFYTGSQDYFEHTRSTTRGGPEYLDLHQQDRPVLNETGHYSTHLFTERAIGRIQAHDASKPMFLFVSYQAVHEPLQVPEEYEAPYRHIECEDRRKYAAMTTAMDEGIANLTQALKDKGMWDDTVFVFSTDNGGTPVAGGNNYPLRGYKGSLFDGGIRAVGFVHAKNLQTAGNVSKALMHISDWYPTFVGLAGGSLNGTLPLDGYDVWDAISKGHRSSRTEILHEIDPLIGPHGDLQYPETQFDNRFRAALRLGEWKIITGDPSSRNWDKAPPHSRDDTTQRRPVYNESPSKNLWLYHVATDPREEHDLSTKRPDVVRRLLSRLAAYNATAVPVRYPPEYSPESNPARHMGIWEPWVREYESEQLPRYATFVPTDRSWRTVRVWSLVLAASFLTLFLAVRQTVRLVGLPCHKVRHASGACLRVCRRHTLSWVGVDG